MRIAVPIPNPLGRIYHILPVRFSKITLIFRGTAILSGLVRYWDEGRAIADSPVFRGERGPDYDEGLRSNGLLQLIQRLGLAAELQAVRCSPHTFPHTFAIEFPRAGGNQFTLKEMLGHTTLDMRST